MSMWMNCGLYGPKAKKWPTIQGTPEQTWICVGSTELFLDLLSLGVATSQLSILS